MNLSLLGLNRWGTSLALLLLLSGGVPYALSAQPLFALECALKVQEMIEQGTSFDAESIHRLMGETGTLTYKGENSVEGRILVFFVGKGGEVKGTMTTDAFEMEPGTRPIDDLIPGGHFREHFEEFLTGSEYDVEQSFSPATVSLSELDSEDRMLKIVYEKINWKHDGEAAVGFAFVPVISRYTEGWEEVRIQSTGIAASTRG